MNNDERARRMIELMDRLCDVLEQENEAISAGKYEALEPIVQEKEILFRNYESQTTAMAAIRNFTLDLTLERMEELFEAGAELEELALQNRTILESAKRAGEYLIATYAAAAQQTLRRPEGYDARGEAGLGGTKRVAVTINQKL